MGITKGLRPSVKRVALAGFACSLALLLYLHSDSPVLTPETEPLSARTVRSTKEETSNDVSKDIQLIDLLDEALKQAEDAGQSRLCVESRKTFAQHWEKKFGLDFHQSDAWDHFFANIDNCDLYRAVDAPEIKALLADMRRMRIEEVENLSGGTQLKLLLTFANGKKAIAKPMRFGRDHVVDPNHFYFSEYERHNAEIATFHLDSVLGIRHVLPTTGRSLNLTKLKRKSEPELAETFFKSPAGNHCFFGSCDYYCDVRHPVCGQPESVEFSLQVSPFRLR